MAKLGDIEKALASIAADDKTTNLLRDLHTQALSEVSYVSTDSQPVTAALDRFVALEPDKCAFVYLLLRSSKAKYVVEAGTSFGVSTIYLALAVSQNAAAEDGQGVVIATENEPTKAARARRHWKEAGVDLDKWIDLREGDLTETLKSGLPQEIDFLLLDIWAVLALPTLRLVQPRMKAGATVVVDNIVAGSAGYQDLLEYLGDPKNGFKGTTLPYTGGLFVAVYLGYTHA